MTSKPNLLAKTVSTGGPFEDGSIDASEVSGLAAVATSGTYTDLSGTPTLDTLVPTQTGQANKFLTTDGTTANWDLVDVAGSVTGTLPPANGGTGLSDPGTSGNALISDGTNWVRQAVPTPDEILQPTNVSPADEATDIGETPTLTGSTYYSLYGIDMAAGQWQVSTVSDFATTVVDTGDVAGAAVSYNVPSGILSTSTEYYWRVRYKDDNGNYSEWSDATTFTTAAEFAPTVIGQSFGGGFYAGNINEGGTEYYVIVSPKASGENSSKQYKTTNDDAPVATKTLNNGPAASASMNSSTYPAAQFCEGLTIGGFSDWYLPARDELELCYRNLKPTTDSNNTSDRAKSAYTYPEGNDLSADTMGVNRNSEPTGAAYTSGDPAQTSVTDFQTGNSEAFASAGYWSSSEFSSTSAWRQFFGNGLQDDSLKSNNFFYVRAVRRVPV